MRVVSFNNQATKAIQGRKGGKLRLEVKDNSLFVRPTDRKAGPHVLAELQGDKDQDVNVEILDKNLEKMGAGDILADASSFGLKATKYGWYTLTAQDAEGNIEGALVTVSQKDEPTEEPAEQPTEQPAQEPTAETAEA